ncbi:serrate RNA effector molecule homolog [Geospiza fortis]|uniref:Serrate RNA effector molecule homolog n=1 Tax=Geospiza fortis TaxID=48883 RepID=A0A8N5F079_GEOFO|nr:serrate RNA effector molecule homolog [Geospiza fortis]
MAAPTPSRGALQDGGAQGATFSPPRHELSPPQKRLRRDWDDHSADPYHGGYELPYGGGGAVPPPNPRCPPRLGTIAEVDLGMAPPVMKSFKEFLLSLDDAVDETGGRERYNDYKLDFRRQQLQEFFLAHKDEEWYVPRGVLECSVPQKCAGDPKMSWEPQKCWHARTRSGTCHGGVLEPSVPQKRPGDPKNVLETPKIQLCALKMFWRPQNSWPMRSGTCHGGFWNFLCPKNDPRAPKCPGITRNVLCAPKMLARKDEEWYVPQGGFWNVPCPKSVLETPTQILPISHPNSSPAPLPWEHGWFDNLLLDIDRAPQIIKTLDAAVIKMEGGTEHDLRILEQEEEEERAEKAEGPKKEEPRPPEPPGKGPAERPDGDDGTKVAGFWGFFRRGWVTFDRSVNIKEICWSLQNIREGQNPVLQHIPDNVLIVPTDVPNVPKRAQNPVLRHITGYVANVPIAVPNVPNVPKQAQNPVLRHIAGDVPSVPNVPNVPIAVPNVPIVPIDVPNVPIVPIDVPVAVPRLRTQCCGTSRVLDRLLLYLRIVHSVDYYNTSEYPNEDEMPNRCGIIHVRGPLPPNRVSHGEVSEWQRGFEARPGDIGDTLGSLGTPWGQPETDRNHWGQTGIIGDTQELGKDKWLCPLSGKKFKGPEFVRKHIFNKHGDKMGAVRKEVLFFNNFLMDPKRPALPEGGKGGPGAGPNAGQCHRGHLGVTWGSPVSPGGPRRPSPG